MLILPVNQYEQVDNLPEYLKVVEDGDSQVKCDQPETPKSKEALEDQDGTEDLDYDDVMPPPGYDSEDYDDVGWKPTSTQKDFQTSDRADKFSVL